MLWVVRTQVNDLLAEVEAELVLAQVQVTQRSDGQTLDQWSRHVMLLGVSCLQFRHHVDARLDNFVFAGECERVFGGDSCYQGLDQRDCLLRLEVLAGFDGDRLQRRVEADRVYYPIER